jgi:hypothetical protein
MDILNIFIGWVSEMGLKYLPKWLSHRIYPIKRINSEIEIKFRSTVPIHIYHSDLPRISLYLEITNHSPMDLVLDRLFMRVQISSSPVLFGVELKRHEIPKRDTTPIYFEDILTSVQDNYLKSKRHPRTELIEQINVEVMAYFESDSGRIISERSIYALNVP